MKTVLIVDDTRTMREFLKELIESLGFRTIVCDDGEEAVPHICEADVIITDFLMPKMNGAELARIAKSQRPEMPVLMVTGTLLNEIPKDHQADKVIEKPFQNEELMLWLSRP